MSRHRLILIEGVDGVGKTTITKLLCLKLGAQLFKSPQEPFEKMRVYYDNHHSHLARYLFYISTLVAASRDINEKLESGDLVCDRYLVSTLAYHDILGVDTTVVDIDKLGLPEPTYSFCLTAKEYIRNERRRIRGDDLSQVDNNGLDYPDYLNKVSQRIISFCDYVIDTSFKSPPVVVSEIINYLNGYINPRDII